jgi:hypothetical protein
MNTSRLLQLIDQLPFEPFEIRTTTGECLTVEKSSQIATSPNTASCAVYAPGGDLRIIDLDRIADVRPSAPAPIVVQPPRREIGYIVLCWIVVLCMLPQILYMTGITPTGPVPGVNLFQSVACAIVLVGVAYTCLRTMCWR